MDYLIIGNGVAGFHCASAIRREDKDGAVTVLTDEQVPFYSRPLIVDVMTGKKREEEILLAGAGWYRRKGINLVTGVAVESIDVKKRQVVSGKRKWPYDRLLIATGSTAKEVDLKREGVFSLRTLTDATGVRSHLPKVKRAIVYGGGPVGVKAAYALLLAGFPVTVVVSSPRILSRVVDGEGSARFQRLFEEKGATFLLGREIAGTLGRGRLTGVVTDKGEEIKGELLIVGKGVTPAIALAREAGIGCGEGIVVDETMATDAEGVYGAGDAAEAPLPRPGGRNGRVRGVVSLWHTGAAQGRTAGTNMAGREAPYEGSVAANSLEYFGLPCISIGDVNDRDRDTFVFEEKGSYRKFLFQGARLVGAVLIGNTDGAGILLDAVRTGRNIRGSLSLLGMPRRGGNPTMEVLF